MLNLGDAIRGYYQGIQNRYDDAMSAFYGAEQRSRGSNSAQTGSHAGDAVHISEEARKAAEQAELTYSPVDTVTSKNGSVLVIMAALSSDGSGQYAAVRVNWTRPDGVVVTHDLKDNALITQDEDGQWNLTYPNEPGGELQGTDGDDLIILIPGREGRNNIDAGEGDNTVLDFSSGYSRIVTGSGNDRIIGFGGGTYDVASGDGNDTITLKGDYARVDAGNGDDLIEIEGAISVDIDGGAGNDTINIKSGELYKADIRGGDGDDKITLTSSVYSSVIDGGAGNDTITADGRAASGRGAVMFNATVSGGDGDDVIAVKGSVSSSAIEGGAGNDNISIGFVVGGVVDGGDGDDTITADSMFGSTFAGGTGHDSINVKSMFDGRIEGGDGNDTINVDSLHSMLNLDPGAKRTGGTIDGGAGDDNITVSSADNSTIMGGAGDDAIHVENAVNSKLVGDSGTVAGRSMVNDEENEDGEAKESASTGSDATTPDAPPAQNTSAGNDRISVGSASNSIIIGGGGNDTITVQSMYASAIFGGAGDDSINVSEAADSTIYGGDGDDNIEVGESDNSTISGGRVSENEMDRAREAAVVTLSRRLTEFEEELEALSRGDTTHFIVRARIRAIEEQRDRIMHDLANMKREPSANYDSREIEYALRNRTNPYGMYYSGMRKSWFSTKA